MVFVFNKWVVSFPFQVMVTNLIRDEPDGSFSSQIWKLPSNLH